MTETSYNGWPASPTLTTRTITPVPGRSFRIVDNDNVDTIFTYVIQQFHKRVEPIDVGQFDDWGYAYRADKNDPSSLSCHASGTAVDLNAVKHPNGDPNTFTPAQIAEMKKIIAEVDGTVQCGQFYKHTIDGMHWEINVPPGHLQVTAARLRAEAARPVTPPKPSGPSVVEQARPDLNKALKKLDSANPSRKKVHKLADMLRDLIKSLPQK